MPSRNQNGQKIGDKGKRTRAKLIDATIALLETLGLRDVTVAEVAKVAGTSPATFYVYFDGVAEVVLAALETAVQVTPETLSLLEEDFHGQPGFKVACRFVEHYVEQWNKHRTAFRIRNLAAEEGDDRFLKARQNAASPVMDILATKIARSRQAIPSPVQLEPRAIAGTILIMLERLGAVGPLMKGDEQTSLPNLTLAAAHFLQFALVPAGSH